MNGPLPEAGGLAGHLGAAVVVGHLVVVEQGVAAPAKIIHSYYITGTLLEIVK